MKIAIITGSYPPDTCGIGDYTAQLVNALVKKGTATEVICRENWSLRNISEVLKSIHAVKPDIIHIQYPTAGFGKKLTPQLLSLMMPSVITIHEVTKAHILRKLSLYPFAIRSRHIVFTTPFERSFSIRSAPWISGRSSVIPVGSSIRTAPENSVRDHDCIVYFGLFRPNKGIEDVFTLASLVKKRGLPFFVRMVGKPFPEGSDYSRELYRRSKELPIEWDIDLPEDSIAGLLAQSGTAYMPFPDGASGRRTSLLALLANGVATITTRGSHTPDALDRSVLFAENPEKALRMAETIRADGDLRKRLSDNGRAYAELFSWDTIAARHIQLYENLLRERGRG